MSNQLLRERLQAFGEEHQMEVLIPPLACVWKRGVRRRECTDNAVMIAWRGLQLWEAGRSIVPYQEVDAVRYEDRLPFERMSLSPVFFRPSFHFKLLSHTRTPFQQTHKLLISSDCS